MKHYAFWSKRPENGNCAKGHLIESMRVGSIGGSVHRKKVPARPMQSKFSRVAWLRPVLCAPGGHNPPPSADEA